jgi:hypothetical protein
MTIKMGNSEPTNYSTLSTAQLEDMLSRSTRWEEQIAIGEELNRRYTDRMRAEAGSNAEQIKHAPKDRYRPNYQEREQDSQLPSSSMAPPGFDKGQQPSYQPSHPPQHSALRPTRKNRLAIASLVFGILGFTVLGSIAGLIVGFIALKQIKTRNQAGRGLAIAGIVISALWLLALGGYS